MDDLKTVYELYSSTGVRDKVGTELYALGWTQHTVGSQNIRTMAIIQSLLGNMGVAGGESTLCAGSQTSRDRPTRQYCRISSRISQGAGGFPGHSR